MNQRHGVNGSTPNRILDVHESSRYAYKIFLDVYLQRSVNSSYDVLEVGSRDVNGSILRDERTDITWRSVDIEAGPGVTDEITDPYMYPFADESFDAVISTSVFEHMEFFWLAFLEMARVCKQNGYIYINAPSNGSIHRFPIDAWRFYPDAGSVLSKWAIKNGFKIALAESLMLNRSNESAFVDSIYVFNKGGSIKSNNTDTLKNHFGDSVYFDGTKAVEHYKSIPHPDNLFIKEVRIKLKEVMKIVKSI
jgi:SAM-dependent methyltransferase